MNSHDTRMSAVRRYIDALGAGDAATLTDLFTPDGEVISPLIGRLPAAEFFSQLGELTASSELTLLDVLTSVSDPRRVAAYFRYRWTLRSGPVVEFDCCDIFEFAQVEADRPQIELMTIIYDTAPTRERMAG